MWIGICLGAFMLCCGLVIILEWFTKIYVAYKTNVTFCEDCKYCYLKCKNKKSDYYGWSALRLKEMGNWCNKGQSDEEA